MSSANRQIQEEAAAWLIEFNTGAPDAGSRERFDAWLRASPAHIRAYLELLPLWHDSASLSQVKVPTCEELLALARQPAANVTVLQVKASGARSALRARSFSSLRVYAFAATVLIGLAAVLLFPRLHSNTRDYRTEIAEIRQLTFEDGTKVTIGADSNVQVRYSSTERKLLLSGGDLYLDVAKDPMRPFLVIAGTSVVRALGTQFEVRFNERTVRVAVIEGQVAVAGSATLGPNRKPVLLKSGQQLVARAGGAIEAPQPIKSNEPAAWRSGRLVFDDATLAEVIEEFNRYHARRLILEDDSLSHIRISAAFSSADSAALIRFLRDQPDIEVTESSRGVRIDSARSRP